MSRLEDTTKEGKMLIQNLSKIDFQDKNLDDNILNLIIIYFFLLAICDRERERKKKRLCHGMRSFHLHSAVDIQPFPPVFPLAGYAAKASCWLFLWGFKEGCFKVSG